MHMHAIQSFMRTTIEITAEQRSRLMALAAIRGETGFSHLVREALDEYLASRSEDEAKIQKALAVKGILTEREAESFLQICRDVREDWR